jgi:hypothetical protein
MPKNIVVFSDGTGQDGGARREQRKQYLQDVSGVARSSTPVMRVPIIGTSQLISLSRQVRQTLSFYDRLRNPLASERLGSWGVQAHRYIEWTQHLLRCFRCAGFFTPLQKVLMLLAALAA